MLLSLHEPLEDRRRQGVMPSDQHGQTTWFFIRGKRAVFLGEPPGWRLRCIRFCLFVFLGEECLLKHLVSNVWIRLCLREQGPPFTSIKDDEGYIKGFFGGVAKVVAVPYCLTIVAVA